MTWPGWVVGILAGIVLMFVAQWALANQAQTVAMLVADVGLVKTAVGAVGFAIGLGSLSTKAMSVGLTKLTTSDVAGPASLAVACALLLA